MRSINAPLHSKVEEVRPAIFPGTNSWSSRNMKKTKLHTFDIRALIWMYRITQMNTKEESEVNGTVSEEQRRTLKGRRPTSLTMGFEALGGHKEPQKRPKDC